MLQLKESVVHHCKISCVSVWMGRYDVQNILIKSDHKPCLFGLTMSELLILSCAPQVRWGREPVSTCLHGLQVLKAHQCQSDLGVPSRPLLWTPKVNLLSSYHDHSEVHQPSFVLHTVHRSHALKSELLGFGAPRWARSIATTTTGALTVVQAQTFVREHAALFLPQLEEPAAALLQQPVSHHLGWERHGRAKPGSSVRLKYQKPSEINHPIRIIYYWKDVDFPRQNCLIYVKDWTQTGI